MIWTRTTAYALESGRFVISKCIVRGEARYTLADGGALVGVYDSAEAAKAEAERRA